MRLIDADKLDWWYKGRPIRRVIDEAPTVDAVPVVRCKDCIWFSKTGYNEENDHEDDLYLHMGHCSVFRTETQACRFCSYGERKDNVD